MKRFSYPCIPSLRCRPLRAAIFSRQPPLLCRRHRRRRHRRGRRGANQRLLHPVAVVEPLQHAGSGRWTSSPETPKSAAVAARTGSKPCSAPISPRPATTPMPLRMAFALGRNRAVQHRDQQPRPKASRRRFTTVRWAKPTSCGLTITIFSCGCSAVCPCAWSPTTPVNPRPLQRRAFAGRLLRADHCRLQTGHLAPSGQEQLLVGRLQPRLEGCRPHDAGRHLPDLAARNPTMPTSSRSASRSRPWVTRPHAAANLPTTSESPPRPVPKRSLRSVTRAARSMTSGAATTRRGSRPAWAPATRTSWPAATDGISRPTNSWRNGRRAICAR